MGDVYELYVSENYSKTDSINEIQRPATVDLLLKMHVLVQ